MHAINNDFIFEMKNVKGKSKEYDFSGNLEYDDEYLNEEKNEKGKEYN